MDLHCPVTVSGSTTGTSAPNVLSAFPEADTAASRTATQCSNRPAGPASRMYGGVAEIEALGRT